MNTGPQIESTGSVTKDEPVAAANTAVSVVAAVVALLASFGLVLSPDQSEAVLRFVAIVGPIAAMLWSRRKVTPMAKLVGSRDR